MKLAYQVECTGCGAPTAYHEHACSYCTRPTGRQPRVQAEMIEVTCMHDLHPVFVSGISRGRDHYIEEAKRRQRARNTGAR